MKGWEVQKTNKGIKSLAKIYTLVTPVILSGFNRSFGCIEQNKPGKNCLLALVNALVKT